MAQLSSIEWTDATWNPTRGCTEIAPGCAHCYAKTFAERFRGVKGHPYERGFDPRTAPDKLTEPLKWKKPRRIFVDSMSDLFHEAFGFDYIAAVFAVMAMTPQHTYQVLTKRPERAVEFFAWLGDDPAGKIGDAASDHLGFEDIDCAVANYINGWSRFSDDGNPCNGTLKRWPLPNAHIGTSIANQTDADKNIPHLLRIPAAVRFLSIEPLIGPVNLGEWFTRPSRDAEMLLDPYYSKDGFDPSGSQPTYPLRIVKPPSIQWVIVGGESGPGARPCSVEWIQSIVAQCRAAGVPVFVKQLGAHFIDAAYSDCAGEHRPPLRDRKGGDPSEWPADLRVRQFPKGKA
jgi:protein gp37